MKRTLLLILIIGLSTMTGCVAHNYGQKSYLAPDMPQFPIAEAATDIAEALAFNYPPGHTTLALVNSDNAFNQVLENKLRANGFKIESGQNGQSGAITLLYKIDRLVEESGCYLTVTLSDGFIYSRIYKVDKNACIPVSALSGRK